MPNKKAAYPPFQPEDEKVLRRIPLEIFGLSLLIALVSLLISDLLTSLFILGGGMLSALSFIWLKQALSKFLLFEKKKILKYVLAFYCLRLILILVIFFIIIYFFSKKITAFVVGFSAIVPIFLIETAIALTRIKRWKS